MNIPFLFEQEITFNMKLQYTTALLTILIAINASANGGVLDGSIGKSTWKLIEAMYLPCQKFTFTEIFHRPGCDPVRISNHFCGGRCLSMFYPTLPRKCFACLPKKVRLLNVKFNCSDTKINLLTYRTFQIVESCQCRRIQCVRN